MTVFFSKTLWMLYAKKPGAKRFHPINWSTGNVVVNRIHATMFSEDQAYNIRADIPQLELANPGWSFDLRKCD
jgi:hypothetical protein